MASGSMAALPAESAQLARHVPPALRLRPHVGQEITHPATLPLAKTVLLAITAQTLLRSQSVHQARIAPLALPTTALAKRTIDAREMRSSLAQPAPTPQLAHPLASPVELEMNVLAPARVKLPALALIGARLEPQAAHHATFLASYVLIAINHPFAAPEALRSLAITSAV